VSLAPPPLPLLRKKGQRRLLSFLLDLDLFLSPLRFQRLCLFHCPHENAHPFHHHRLVQP
jgi:hypothetical protein